MRSIYYSIQITMLFLLGTSHTLAQDTKWVKGADGVYRQTSTVAPAKRASSVAESPAGSLYTIPKEEPPQYSPRKNASVNQGAYWVKDADGVYRLYFQNENGKREIFSSDAPAGDALTRLPSDPETPTQSEKALVRPARGLNQNELMNVESSKSRQLWAQQSDGFFSQQQTTANRSQSTSNQRTAQGKTFLNKIEGLTFVNLKAANRDLPIAKGIRILSLPALQSNEFGEAMAQFVGKPLTVGSTAEIESITRQFFMRNGRNLKEFFIPRQKFEQGVVFIMIEE